MKTLNICILLLLIAFILLYLLYRRYANKAKNEANKSETIYSPLNGNVIGLSEVSDPAFSNDALGKGIGIIPTSGEVVSPADGIVTILFPTKHAIGITTKQGAEVLIHIGVDTVNLNGEGFEAFIKQGDKVKKGQKLISFDLENTKAKGYDVTSVIVITNSNDLRSVTPIHQGEINKEEKIIELYY